MTMKSFYLDTEKNSKMFKHSRYDYYVNNVSNRYTCVPRRSY